MPNWLNDLSDLVQVIGFPTVIFALFLGWRQLVEADRTAKVQTLLGLDARLAAFEDVRQQLNQNSQVDEIELRRYIGAFERVGYALKHKQVTLETVDQFYGSRFKRLVEQPKTSQIATGAGWEDFHYLWDALYGYAKNSRNIMRRDGQRL